jgi:CheY-like chemotaxis protein
MLASAPRSPGVRRKIGSCCPHVRAPHLDNPRPPMRIQDPSAATIMIASDKPADAEQVRVLLHTEFDHIFVSTDPFKVPGDFVRHEPNILILAFDSLQKAERYYLDLYRLCELVHQYPHRTLILCHKDEIQQIYELCKKDYFDDYVLFWPLNNDSSRLLMSVHHALRELTALENSGPSAVEFAAQARKMAKLEVMLEQQLSQGGEHIAVTNRALEQTEENIGMALDSLPGKLISGALAESVEVKDRSGLESGISRFRQDEVQPHFTAARLAVEPMKQWASEFKRECEPFLQSAREMGTLAAQLRPTVLVVDDEESQRILIGKLLNKEKYNLLFARDGLEALNILRKKRPDLILMDMNMPDMDGAETTRRIKAVPEFAATPVIMVTGRSEEEVIAECRHAGAVDFVVKPFHHITLVAKIAHALNTPQPQ